LLAGRSSRIKHSCLVGVLANDLGGVKWSGSFCMVYVCDYRSTICVM